MPLLGISATLVGKDFDRNIIIPVSVGSPLIYQIFSAITALLAISTDILTEPQINKIVNKMNRGEILDDAYNKLKLGSKKKTYIYEISNNIKLVLELIRYTTN